MELSSVQLAAIMHELQSETVQLAAPDKRMTPRMTYNSTVVITLCPDGVHSVQRLATTVILRNVSSRGIGILYHLPLERGEQFVITLFSAQSQPVSLLCTIAHCRKITEHQFEIGSEFTCVVGSLPAPNPDDVETKKRIRSAILD